jgi:hypothetical protein
MIIPMRWIVCAGAARAPGLGTKDRVMSGRHGSARSSRARAWDPSGGTRHGDVTADRAPAAVGDSAAAVACHLVCRCFAWHERWSRINADTDGTYVICPGPYLTTGFGKAQVYGPVVVSTE